MKDLIHVGLRYLTIHNVAYKEKKRRMLSSFLSVIDTKRNIFNKHNVPVPGTGSD